MPTATKNIKKRALFFILIFTLLFIAVLLIYSIYSYKANIGKKQREYFVKDNVSYETVNWKIDDDNINKQQLLSFEVVSTGKTFSTDILNNKGEKIAEATVLQVFLKNNSILKKDNTLNIIIELFPVETNENIADFIIENYANEVEAKKIIKLLESKKIDENEAAKLLDRVLLNEEERDIDLNDSILKKGSTFKITPYFENSFSQYYDNFFLVNKGDAYAKQASYLEFVKKYYENKENPLVLKEDSIILRNVNEVIFLIK